MSALPTQLDRYFDPQRWVKVEEVATAYDRSIRTIQLLCKNGTLPAKHGINDETGKPCWYIDRAAAIQHFGLVNQKEKAEEIAYAQLPAEQRIHAARMAALIREVDNYIESHPVELKRIGGERKLIAAYLGNRRLTQADTPSVATYYRKKKALLESRESLLAVVDKRKVSSMRGGLKAEFTEDAWRWFWSMWATQQRREAKNVYDWLIVEAEQHHPDWVIPSYKTVLRRLEEVPEADRVEARYGKKARQDGFDAYIVRSYNFAADDFWISDHHELDVLAYDDLPGSDGKPIRMWITTWMDARSRKILGWRFSRNPNAAVVMASYVETMLDAGIPRGIYIDNGKDYRCKRFAGGRPAKRDSLDDPGKEQTHVQSILAALNTEVTFALPYNARAKIVENWHEKWLVNKFARSIPGYVGAYSKDRPEELKDIVKAKRLDRWSNLMAYMAELIAAYNMSPHSGEGMNGKSPDIVYAETSINPKRTCNIHTARLLLQEHEFPIVGRNGVEVRGHFYGADSIDLMRYQGEKVHVRLDSFRGDVVYVYTLQDCFICEAQNWRLTEFNATREDVEAAQKLVKHVNKERKKIASIERIADMPSTERVFELQRLAAERKAAQLPAPELPDVPAPIRPAEFHEARPHLQLTERAGIPAGPKTEITVRDLDRAREDTTARTDPGASAASQVQRMDPWAAFADRNSDE